MRNFKKFLTSVLAVMMVASSFAFNTSATKFTDVPADDEYLNSAVGLLEYVGVTKGTSETEFGTDELVTREQMAAFIYRLVKKGAFVANGSNTTAFKDLEDQTYFYSIAWANSQGIIKGTSATTFDPKGSITLQDAYVMLVRALGYETEETLPYPFGYITVAETEDVELNEGLSTTVSYTDALTRGEVAVLLYNTFFAETGVAETKEEEEHFSNGDPYLKTTTVYPTFCEKYFDVDKVEYVAVATPHYVDGVQGEESSTTSSFGYPAICFKKAEDEDNAEAPSQFFWDFDKLGLDGEADDYILGHFDMYVTLDDDDEIDSILFAESKMNKVTVDEIKLETVDTNSKYSYFDQNETAAGTDAAKLLTGKATINGKTAYFFNAPYSYAAPNYSDGISTDAWLYLAEKTNVDSDDVSDAAKKYYQRNEKNLQFITLDDIDVDDGEYSFEESFIEWEDVDAEKDYYNNNSKQLIAKMTNVYAGGIYKADVYDVDGDGLYDYIRYMPYTAYTVNTDDDYTFEDDVFDDDGNLYTNDAVLSGVEFQDEDVVIAYANSNLNVIDVLAVVEPIEATVKKIVDDDTVRLSDGEEYATNAAWKLNARGYTATLEAYGYNLDEITVEKSGEFEALTESDILTADAGKFYVYNGILFMLDDIDASVEYDGKLVILTADPDNDDQTFDAGSFDPNTGKRVTYAYAWVDGKLGYINVETDTDETDVFPAIDKEETMADALDDRLYVGRIATYDVDSNGFYTLKLLNNAYDDDPDDEDADAEYIGLRTLEEDKALGDESYLADEDDDTKQVYAEVESGYLTKLMSKRFTVAAAAEAKDNEALGFDLVLTADTKIVIRNIDEDGDIEFLEYTASSLTETIKTELKNIQMVIANNTDYTSRENLVLLYAETDEDIDFKSTDAKKSDRIVKVMEPTLDENDKVVYLYTVLNPYTGAKETAYANKSSKDAKYDVGDIVTITDGGEIDISEDAVDTIFNKDNYVWILDYDEENEVIEVGAVGGDETVEHIIYVGDASVVKAGSTSYTLSSDMIKYCDLTTLEQAKLGSSENSLKAVNTKYTKGSSDKYTTVYGKYIKAYISSEEADEDEDYDLEANYVVIIVHYDEDLDNCKLK